MGKLIASFVLGAATAALIAWLFAVPQVRESYRAVGYNDGLISARTEMADEVDRRLGSDITEAEPRETIYHEKTISLVVVERNGVKTLRTVR